MTFQSLFTCLSQFIYSIIDLINLMIIKIMDARFINTQVIYLRARAKFRRLAESNK